MSSDLENELREAMADLVGDTYAGRSLARDVKRRHHRRKLRKRTTSGALAIAAAVAVVPVYQTMYGDDDSQRSRGAGNELAQSPPPSAPASPSPPQKGSPRPSTPAGTQHPVPPPGKPPKPPRHQPEPEDVLTLTYVPHGTWRAHPCAESELSDGHVTTCQWDASEGSTVKLEVISQQDLSDPEEIGGVAFFVEESQVHGQRALLGGVPFLGRVIKWIERPGTGIRLSASGPAAEELVRIAEGANIPSG